MNSAISSALMHFVWQGAAIACALAIALIFVRSPRVRYGLAFLALMALPIVFGVTVWLAMPAETERIVTRFIVPWTPGFLDDAPSSSSVARASWNIVSIWTAGAALVIAYRLAGWLAAQRIRRVGICAASPEWQKCVSRLSSQIGLKRTALLLESALAEVPATIGSWRPVILIPLGLLTGLPAQHVESILLHELAHISRYDYFVNLIQAAVEAVLFYHPATWWISHVMRRERELCCDDLVIAATGDRATYAKALGALEQHRSRQPILAATGGQLVQRIHRLLGRATSRASSVVPAIIFLMTASAAASFAFYPEPLPMPEPIPMPSPAPAPEPMPAPSPQAPEQSVPVMPTPSPSTEPVSNPAYRNWLNEEVVWIISDEERAAFRRLTTDDERYQFIEQFWLRRDPTPDTESNEMKEEHYRRIAWANDRFSTRIPGWKTDRGMVYVKYGAPDEKEEHPNDNPTTFPYEKWRYKFIEGLGQDLILEFVDQSGRNEYRLSWNPGEKDSLLRIPGAGLYLYEQWLLLGLERPPSDK